MSPKIRKVENNTAYEQLAIRYKVAFRSATHVYFTSSIKAYSQVDKLKYRHRGPTHAERGWRARGA